MRMELAFLPERAFMLRALELAEEAAAAGEIPVGAVVVKDGRIIGEGRNRREAAGNALAHAEVEAIERACRTLGGWRLTGCQLYVTLEPCPMCAGAAVNARVERIVYGLDDFTAGCRGSAADVLRLAGARRVEVYRGYMEEACRDVMDRFFKKLRGG